MVECLMEMRKNEKSCSGLKKKLKQNTEKKQFRSYCAEEICDGANPTISTIVQKFYRFANYVQDFA